MEEAAPSPPDELTLYRSIVEGMPDLAVAFTDDGTVVFANTAIEQLLGMTPTSVVGTNVLNYMHPDDLDRAVRSLTLNSEHGSSPGVTSFRLRNAQGDWSHVDMTGGHATDDGQRSLYTSFSRPADARFAMRETLHRLLGSSPLTETLRPVCDNFEWNANGSQVGISWVDASEIQCVTTGIDGRLVGGEDPWERARITGTPVMDLSLELISEPLRQLALDAGYGSYWIEPVPNPMGGFALVTIWTKIGGRPPIHHALAMATVHPIIELILGWVDQQRRLDSAVYHDPLTGVANRARVFETLSTCNDHGAVLYCDLDHFKPINDTYGHRAGDELLQQFAARLQSCVRGDDLVARLGGDEFVILCYGGTAEIAEAIAARINAAVSKPFKLSNCTVDVQVSIGIAHDPRCITEETLDAADKLLYLAKGRRA